MPENLANTSTILLFGREIEDINIVPGGGGAGLPHAGPSHILAAQIAAPDSRLARIYSFAFEGNYFELSRPTLFLIHGQGAPVAQTVELSGLAATARDFAADLLVWAYDKADLSVRLDVETGTLERILLEGEMIAGQGQFAGQMVRYSGQMARYSGQMARMRGRRDTGNDD